MKNLNLLLTFCVAVMLGSCSYQDEYNAEKSRANTLQKELMAYQEKGAAETLLKFNGYYSQEDLMETDDYLSLRGNRRVARKDGGLNPKINIAREMLHFKDHLIRDIGFPASTKPGSKGDSIIMTSSWGFGIEPLFEYIKTMKDDPLIAGVRMQLYERDTENPTINLIDLFIVPVDSEGNVIYEHDFPGKTTLHNTAYNLSNPCPDQCNDN